MKFISFEKGGVRGLAVETSSGLRGATEDSPDFPGDLMSLLDKGQGALQDAASFLATAGEVSTESLVFLPPIARPGKIICVGLNYRDHSKESGFEQPAYPTLFGRFTSSLVAHRAPILRPLVSEELDFEGELVAVIGRQARRVSVDEALNFIAGYSLFNDASIRNYQFKAPQWTPGKNFDDTGAFGPCFVTADALPPGCRGLTLTTRLNGQTVQQATIDEMVFSVAELVSICSEFTTLEVGDVLVTGTHRGGRGPSAEAVDESRRHMRGRGRRSWNSLEPDPKRGREKTRLLHRRTYLKGGNDNDSNKFGDPGSNCGPHLSAFLAAGSWSIRAYC